MRALATAVLLGMVVLAVQLVGHERGAQYAATVRTAYPATAVPLTSAAVLSDKLGSRVPAPPRLGETGAAVNSTDLRVLTATCTDCETALPAVAVKLPSPGSIDVRPANRNDSIVIGSDLAALATSLPPGVWLLITAFVGLVGVARRKERS